MKNVPERYQVQNERGYPAGCFAAKSDAVKSCRLQARKWSNLRTYTVTDTKTGNVVFWSSDRKPRSTPTSQP